MEVHGTLNVERLYETLAMIISRRENVTATVKVTKKQQEEEKTYKSA